MGEKRRNAGKRRAKHGKRDVWGAAVDLTGGQRRN